MEQMGVRPVIALAKIPDVMAMLRSAPHRLPQGHKERQQDIWLKLGTGLPMELAEVVRDLTWHRHRGHLTLKDSEYLHRGRDRLAAEMAMASDGQVSEANHAIDAALTAGMKDTTNHA
jgi:RNA polymerase-interacting CarD/CdnL/TRCF family regulator